MGPFLTSLPLALHLPTGGFQQVLLEPVLRFHYMLKKLQLHKEEYVLMQAISLFSPDRPGVVQRSVVDQLQEQFAIALKAYIEYNRPQPAHRFLFLKVMATLTELRSISAQHTQRLLRIQDIHPFATPLMCELFSRRLSRAAALGRTRFCGAELSGPPLLGLEGETPRRADDAALRPPGRGPGSRSPQPQPLESKAIDPHMESALASRSGPSRGKAIVPQKRPCGLGFSVMVGEGKG